ncbi:MAG: hypothetical protein EHM20_16650 [Alphaproteobacteria bacterium]|nr:MAG: hypothetical protein EHM20_16650 [Alphaproteobacteria bacterium]
MEEYKLRTKPITVARKVPLEQQIRDTFQTPSYAIDLLIPFIPGGVKVIWECACGNGKIVKSLENFGFSCYTTDIISNDFVDRNFNFITEHLEFDELDAIDCIITNPPFSIKDLFIEKAFEYNIPFAFLINADYSGKTIDWIKRGCEKIVPTSRIAYITPNIVKRVNDGEDLVDMGGYDRIEEIPSVLLYKYSSAQFHSMWLTYKFNLGKTETFVDLSVKERKSNI